jgi:hypothetical protein
MDGSLSHPQDPRYFSPNDKSDTKRQIIKALNSIAFRNDKDHYGAEL